MKKKITIITISLIILLILGISFSNISNAAIEVKPGTSAHKALQNVAYNYCFDMRSSTSTLGNNALDSHLILNKEVGAVLYLGTSTYGNIRDIDGTSVTIGENTYNSTTKNITGVLNLDKGYVTASRRDSYSMGDGTQYTETLYAPFTLEMTKRNGFI